MTARSALIDSRLRSLPARRRLVSHWLKCLNSAHRLMSVISANSDPDVVGSGSLADQPWFFIEVQHLVLH
jgi:hypothetical protein